jgi:hypothetical protein
MSISCWKALDSPNIDISATLFKSFDGDMFYLHGIIISLPIKLCHKTILVVVEVVDAPLQYILLLVQTLFYDMITFVSSIFRVLCLPYQGKIMIINEIHFVPQNLDPM